MEQPAPFSKAFMAGSASMPATTWSRPPSLAAHRRQRLPGRDLLHQCQRLPDPFPGLEQCCDMEQAMSTADRWFKSVPSHGVQRRRLFFSNSQHLLKMHVRPPVSSSHVLC